MAKAGDEITSPAGPRLVFRQTAADTNGQAVVVDAFYEPQGREPVAHYHPKQEERFEVVSGRIATKINHKQQTFEAGDSFVVPKGAPHAMWNPGDTETHLRWTTAPALNTERFFETMWGLARDGRTNRRGVPPLLHIAVIGRDYWREFRLTRPAPPVQWVLFRLLAPLGRRKGYRSAYPEYSGDVAG
jgi:mannose-6-phosphate isomerase-like protein (cupin superfamily)